MSDPEKRMILHSLTVECGEDQTSVKLTTRFTAGGSLVAATGETTLGGGRGSDDVAVRAFTLLLLVAYVNPNAVLLQNGSFATLRGGSNTPVSSFLNFIDKIGTNKARWIGDLFGTKQTFKDFLFSSVRSGEDGEGTGVFFLSLSRTTKLNVTTTKGDKATTPGHEEVLALIERIITDAQKQSVKRTKKLRWDNCLIPSPTPISRPKEPISLRLAVTVHEEGHYRRDITGLKNESPLKSTHKIEFLAESRGGDIRLFWVNNFTDCQQIYPDPHLLFDLEPAQCPFKFEIISSDTVTSLHIPKGSAFPLRQQQTDENEWDICILVSCPSSIPPDLTIDMEATILGCVKTITNPNNLPKRCEAFPNSFAAVDNLENPVRARLGLPIRVNPAGTKLYNSLSSRLKDFTICFIILPVTTNQY